MQTTKVSKIEIAGLAFSVSIWLVAIALSASKVLVVPECSVVANVLLLLSLLAFAAVVFRQLWRRLRWWWSIPIGIIVSYGTLLVALFPGQELRLQLGPASDEGFFYADGFGVCGTYVDGIFENATGGRRIYVLQQYCIPDGPEAGDTYQRLGLIPLMKEVTFVRDPVNRCGEWRAGGEQVALVTRSRVTTYCSRSRGERAPAE